MFGRIGVSRDRRGRSRAYFRGSKKILPFLKFDINKSRSLSLKRSKSRQRERETADVVASVLYYPEGHNEAGVDRNFTIIYPANFYREIKLRENQNDSTTAILTLSTGSPIPHEYIFSTDKFALEKILVERDILPELFDDKYDKPVYPGISTGEYIRVTDKLLIDFTDGQFPECTKTCSNKEDFITMEDFTPESVILQIGDDPTICYDKKALKRWFERKTTLPHNRQPFNINSVRPCTFRQANEDHPVLSIHTNFNEDEEHDIEKYYRSLHRININSVRPYTFRSNQIRSRKKTKSRKSCKKRKSRRR
jgi:hypothetical protein